MNNSEGCSLIDSDLKIKPTIFAQKTTLSAAAAAANIT
jgi:hypothetical protein